MKLETQTCLARLEGRAEVIADGGTMHTQEELVRELAIIVRDAIAAIRRDAQ